LEDTHTDEVVRRQDGFRRLWEPEQLCSCGAPSVHAEVGVHEQLVRSLKPVSKHLVTPCRRTLTRGDDVLGTRHARDPAETAFDQCVHCLPTHGVVVLEDMVDIIGNGSVHNHYRLPVARQSANRRRIRSGGNDHPRHILANGNLEVARLLGGVVIRVAEDDRVAVLLGDVLHTIVPTT